jgi:uncharacterized protein YqgC (DUF456 family)
MDWIYYLSLIVLLFTGLFVNLLGLPGLWLMVLAHGLYAWVTGWNVYVGPPSLVTITVIAGIAEVVEIAAGAAGSKAAGGSKRGMMGAVLGGLVGGMVGTPLIPIPVIGTVVGAVVGAGLGAFVVELMIGRHHVHSFQIGVGAAKGRFYGILAKSCFGIAILMVSMIAAFPVGKKSRVPAGGAIPLTTTRASGPATGPAIER